jgi:hypothetical protein
MLAGFSCAAVTHAKLAASDIPNTNLLNFFISSSLLFSFATCSRKGLDTW